MGGGGNPAALYLVVNEAISVAFLCRCESG